ncbi:MAG: hypothetical protein JHD33_09410 [Chthoniobacterales bacterium]|nr:hypothetical protein [Chthoniobacterales bacterium]
MEPWFSQTLKATLRDKKTIEFSRRSSLLFRETRGLRAIWGTVRPQ